MCNEEVILFVSGIEVFQRDVMEIDVFQTGGGCSGACLPDCGGGKIDAGEAGVRPAGGKMQQVVAGGTTNFQNAGARWRRAVESAQFRGDGHHGRIARRIAQCGIRRRFVERADGVLGHVAWVDRVACYSERVRMARQNRWSVASA